MLQSASNWLPGCGGVLPSRREHILRHLECCFQKTPSVRFGCRVCKPFTRCKTGELLIFFPGTYSPNAFNFSPPRSMVPYPGSRIHTKTVNSFVGNPSETFPLAKSHVQSVFECNGNSAIVQNSQGINKTTNVESGFRLALVLNLILSIKSTAR